MRNIVLAAALFLSAVPAAMADLPAGLSAYRSGDFAQAIAQLKGPAEGGEGNAQYLLGAAYANAAPPLQDLAEAEKWLKMAAAQGHVDAMHSLGNLYMFYRKSSDPASAAPWFRQAAERGHPDAQYWTGLLHFQGEVVPKDWVRTCMWLNLSSKRGHRLADATMRKLRPQFTDEQVAECLKLAREWAPSK